MPKESVDMVSSPPHYKAGGIEVIDVIESFGLVDSFCLGNVVKYVLRAGRKGDIVEDLRKARWYLDRAINRLVPAKLSGREGLQAFDLVYLATPYSKYPGGLTHAYQDAAALAARLMKAGVAVYSPITHSHPIAHYGNIDPRDHSIWLPFETRFMALADALLVAQMSGWEESYGIGQEIEHFKAANKPVLYLDPNTLTHSNTPIAQAKAA